MPTLRTQTLYYTTVMCLECYAYHRAPRCARTSHVAAQDDHCILCGVLIPKGAAMQIVDGGTLTVSFV